MNRQLLKIYLLAVIISLNNNLHSNAQKSGNNVRPAQLTIVTPLGTNGIASGKTINHLSFNLLWGSSAGVLGAEFGGLVNQVNGPVSGVQIGGLGNISSGRLVGVQAGGLLNTTAYGIRGLQIGGLANIASTKQRSPEDDFSSKGSSSGVQAAGLVNLQNGQMTGLQAAGLLNLQHASFKGFQAAGLLNVVSYNFNGVQVAGILNKARNVSGIQIGLINIADTIESGIPLGLINIVKNGYRAVEIETNESFRASLSYKMGIQRFYTIFSVAFKEEKGKPFWAPGVGVGAYLPISQKTGITIDAISYQINEDEWWTDELNQLNTLKINGSFQLAHHLAIYGGVSMNVFVSKVTDQEGNPRTSMFEIPFSFYDEIHKNTRVAIFPGLNAGLRF